MEDYQLIKYYIHHLRNDQDGSSLAEYSLLMALIVVVSVAAVTLMGVNIRTKLFEMAAGV